MFKAIGRWGTQVRAGLNLKFITNIFNSKSKNYDEIDNDEEIFIDAQEELEEVSDTEDDTLVISSTDSGINTDTVDIGNTTEAKIETTGLTDDSSELILVEGRTFDSLKNNTEVPNTCNVLLVEDLKASHLEKEPSDDEHDKDKDDDHHDFHKDTKQIVDTPTTPTNGVIQTAASSAFKKVHRRINSYSQRQYSKFEGEGGDDENDNIVQTDYGVDQCDCNADDGDIVTIGNIDNQSSKTGKKPKMKKKVPLFSFLRGLLRLTPRNDSKARMR